MLSKKEAGLLRPSEGAKCRIVADGCEKTGCPLPTREVVWAPEFFFIFDLNMVSFGAFRLRLVF